MKHLHRSFWLAVVAMFLAIGIGTPAVAKKDKDAGVNVRITVLDVAGAPVPTAVVRLSLIHI